jgi:competence protein ComEC
MDRLVPSAAVAFAAGIAVARNAPPGAAGGILLALSAGALAAGRVPALRRRLPAPFDARAGPILLALAALLGAVRAGIDRLPPGPGDLERLLPGTGLPVLLEGIAVSAPDRITRPAPAGPGRDVAVHVLAFDVDAILGPDGTRPAAGRVDVFVEGDPGPLLPGDRLRVAGVARRPLPARNPGARDRAAAARDRGIAAVVDAPGPGAVARIAEGGPSLARAEALLAAGLRESVRTAFRGEGRALYEALLAGRSGAVDPALARDFRRTGTWHVVVVSGVHVALAAAAAAWILSRVGAGPRTRAAGILLAATAYALASGFGLPARRALLAAALCCAAPLLRRRSDPLQAAGCAAAVLLALRPAALEDPGFQLSFAAVLGILLLGPPLGDLLFARRRFLRRFPVPAADRSIRRRLGDLAERGLPATLAAWAATAPFLAFHFGTVSPVTPLANLVVVPASTAALGIGAALLPLGPAAPGLTAAVGNAVAAVLAGLVRAFAGIPGASLTVPEPPAWLLAADGAALLLAAARPTRGRLLAAGIGLAALAVVPFALPPRPAAPSVLVLDAGHGLAVLCDSGESRVLYDAGGRGPRVGRDAILPALRARGAAGLEAVVLSHEDADHLSAVDEVLESVPVGILVVGEGFGASPPAREVLAAAARAGVPVRRSAAGDVLSWPGLRLEVLHPARGLDPRPTDNDGSLAVRVSMEGLAALLAGDLETSGVGRLLEGGADLRADVLVLPHHGSPLVEGVPFLAAAARARVLVASAGPGTIRVRRVPSPYAPRLLCTADEGAVEIVAEERR